MIRIQLRLFFSTRFWGCNWLKLIVEEVHCAAERGEGSATHVEGAGRERDGGVPIRQLTDPVLGHLGFQISQLVDVDLCAVKVAEFPITDSDAHTFGIDPKAVMGLICRA